MKKQKESLLEMATSLASISATVFLLIKIRHYHPFGAFACNMGIVIVLLFFGEQFLTRLTVFPWLVSSRLFNLNKSAKY